MKKPIIDVYEFITDEKFVQNARYGLIIKYKTGVNYTCQTGGTSCDHPEQEGYIMPLEFSKIDKLNDLACILEETRKGEINQKDVHQLNKTLIKMGYCFLTIDETLLNESMEAWVYVNIDHKTFGKGFINEYVPKQHTTAVLVWDNSD